MATESERTAVWDAMLESEYQRRFWHSKASQFSNREHLLQVCLAVLSSSAVLTALGEMQQLWLWKALSLMTAIVATVQPFLNYTRQSAKMLTVSGQWHQLEIEYESMWRSIDNGNFSEKKFRDLRSRGVEIFGTAADLPFNGEKLQRACYQQVLLGRGAKQ